MRKPMFPNEKQAAEGWAMHYRRSDRSHEMGAFLYSISSGGDRLYFTGRTYRGMKKRGPIHPNVILPFLFLYFFQATHYWLTSGARIEAFLHTHPQPDPGYTYDHFSRIDRWLLFLPMIRAVYLIPYENERTHRLPPLA